MSTPVIAMIGAGNMGSSLIGGLINNGHSSAHIWATDTNQARLDELHQQCQIHTTTDNHAAVAAADIVVFAVKPQLFATVATPLASLMQQRKPLVISIAAGIREASIQTWLGGDLPIVRCMPNTPALIGCGATAIFANAHVSAKQRTIAEHILRAVGIIVWLNDEDLMDAVTALSGSGPAYFFLMMEALQQGAEKLGLPTETARLLTLQTALGAARMAMESGKPLTELRHNVTSPGGTTEAAISVLEKNNMRTLFEIALSAAETRSKELAELMGKS